MKLRFQKNLLMEGINIVFKAIPSKTTMAILECVLIDATKDEITLTCNDMELAIETKVEGIIDESGKIAVDARLFYEIIRKLPDTESDITIICDDSYNTQITCENAMFHIQGMDPEEFSGIPQIERDHYVSLSQLTLKDSIRQTIFSIAPNDSNKMMGGELIEIKDDVFSITSLDGHRISIRSVQLKDHYENEKVIVPGKTLNEISRILGDDNEKEVLVFFGRNHIMFEFDTTVVVSRLIDGEYFKIDHMLTQDYQTKITVNKREFCDSIDRAMILIRDNDRKPLIMDITDQNLNVSILSSYGSMSSDLTIEKTGKDIKIAFNPKFLLDALRVIDEDEVDLYLLTPKSPCYIRNADQSYIYLILPVNFVS